MKKRVISAEDIPDTDIDNGYATPLQDVIKQFILKHPNCTRRDIYLLPHLEGDIRRSLLKMLKSRKIKETFSIVR